jgi:hypothetical protein
MKDETGETYNTHGIHAKCMSIFAKYLKEGERFETVFYL